ncbi:MAG TPA: FtsX-like permease family protein [Gemmataceae bacterium]|nr:FtsX-like permease family protein [Gemmataceae bacterium]
MNGPPPAAPPAGRPIGLALQRTLSVGYLRQHPTRASLVVLSIALGVAALVSTRLLNASMTEAALKSVNPLARLADLVVVSGEARLTRDVAERIEEAHVPGLKDVRPLFITRVALPQLNNRSVWLIGVQLPQAGQERRQADAELDKWGVKVRWSADVRQLLNAFREPRVVVTEGLAEELRKALPDGPRHFKVLAAAGRAEDVSAWGTVEFTRADFPLSGNVIFTDLATAAFIHNPAQPDRVSQINLSLEKGADAEQVRREVQRLVGDRAEVQTLDEHQGMLSDLTAGLQLGFAIGGAGALVIGLFLVYNAMSVNVAERRHDIGILRSVGATRRQIANLFLGEAALLGLCGSALGLPVGYAFAWLALGPVSKVLNDVVIPIKSAQLALSPWLIVVAVASGTLVAVLAALGPALQAAAEEPANAVRRVPRVVHALAWVLNGLAVLLLAGAAASAVALRAQLPQRVGIFAGFVFLLLAALLLTPLLAIAAGRVVRRSFRNVFGLESRLAADNLVKSPVRTGLVVAALAATTALMVATAGFIRSTEDAIHEWVEDKIAADLFVTAGDPITSAGYQLPMDEHVGRELAGLREQGVEAVLPIRFHPFHFRHKLVLMLALDTHAFHGTDGERALARRLEQYPRLREGGTALVSENFAAQFGVQPGDRITVPGRTGTLELEVLGTVVDYTWNRGTVLVDRDWFARTFADNLVDVYDVYLRPGTDAAAVKQLIEARWGKSEALYAETRPAVQQAVTAGVRKVYNLAYAQQFVVGVVALLGVISALFISVLQRRQELGLLRAVGASRGQVLGTVLAEAVLMSVIGAAIGLAVGVVLEWYEIHFMLLDEAGLVFPMRFAWSVTGLVCGLSVLLATLFGLWPAWRATQLRITEAIAYE